MITGQDVSVPRGNTVIVRTTVTRQGEAYDLTNHTLYYTVSNDGSPVFTKVSTDVGSGLKLQDGVTNVIEVTLSDTDTDISPLAYTHELEVVHPDGSKWDVMQGTLTITASIVHPIPA